MAAASPNLELMTALFRAILGDGKSSCKKEWQEKAARTQNGSCHRDRQELKNESRTNDTRTDVRKQIQSLQSQPAIHRQHLAGNKLRSHSEEHHCRGNVRCRPAPEHGRLLRRLF